MRDNKQMLFLSESGGIFLLLSYQMLLSLSVDPGNPLWINPDVSDVSVPGFGYRSHLDRRSVTMKETTSTVVLLFLVSVEERPLPCLSPSDGAKGCDLHEEDSPVWALGALNLLWPLLVSVRGRDRS